MKPGPATSAAATRGSSARSATTASASSRGGRRASFASTSAALVDEVAVGRIARRLDQDAAEIEPFGQRAGRGETLQRLGHAPLEQPEDVHESSAGDRRCG